MSTAYLVIKLIHYFAFMAWAAGLWYLPRIFVYQHGEKPGGPVDRRFVIMGRRLYKAIMTPAMSVLLVAGFLLAEIGNFWFSGWFHVKLVLLAALIFYHFWLSAKLKAFARGERPLTGVAWRVINEIPTVLMLLILVMAVFRPFGG